MTGRTDTSSRLIEAPLAEIYSALLDANALMAWLPPAGMSGRVLLFEPWEGGCYRIELRYNEIADGSGKTTSNSDITAGRFITLEPGKRIVQSVEFESEDEAFAGDMTMTWTFETVATATKVTITAENVPQGISAEDHATGLASSLDNLAAFLADHT